MKQIILLIIAPLIFISVKNIYGQSSILYKTGTILSVTGSADVCANVITINGNFTGNGTKCGGPFSLVLTDTTLIDGFYNGSAMVSDTITVELRNTTPPYTLVESRKGVLNSAGVGTFNFLNAANSTPYYLVFKHRNAVETWSASGKAFSSNVLTYDMTNARTKAYGSNLVKNGSKWCVYSGDVSQDGLVDLTDMIAIDNDNSAFATGYLSTDLNGDNLVDLTDLIIVDNSNNNFVTKIVPSGAGVVKERKQRSKMIKTQ
jgi:hypothetical protein